MWTHIIQLFFKDTPIEYSQTCTDKIIQIGIVEPLFINYEGYEAPLRSFMYYFHPYRKTHLTNTTSDMNISPV